MSGRREAISSSTDQAIQGTVADGFEPVRAAFESAFDGRPLMGAALGVRHRGQVVVDLWGGPADASGSRWNEQTVSVIYSCTKGLLAILAARLVQDGVLDYEAPVARYWPEFAAEGKQAITIKDLLGHRAGLSATREDLSFDDILNWETVVRVLENQRPLWEPGRGHAYHALTQGWLVGEVIRRATGTSVGRRFAELIAEPLGAAAWIGLPPEQEAHVAPSHVGPSLARDLEELARTRGSEVDWNERAITLGGAFPLALAGGAESFSDPRVYRAEIAAAGGIASARALATIWSATFRQTEGVRLLEDETIDRATRVQSEGQPVFPLDPPWARWGMGFQLDSEAARFLTPTGFGHTGAGGQLAFADPGADVGFAFLTTQLEGAGDERASGIVDALRAVLVG